MARTLSLLVVLVGGAVFTWFIGQSAAPRAYVRTTAEADAALEPERALAVEHGLGTVVAEATTPEASIRHEITVEVGDCVALVAITEGSLPLNLRLDVTGLATTQSAGLGHLAACAARSGTAVASIERPLSDFDAHASTHYAFLRGHVIAPRTYARLALSDAQRSALDEESVRVRLDPQVPVDARIGGEKIADRTRAILATPTRASFAALRALSGRPDLAPASDAAPDPFARPDDVPTAPRVFTALGQERVLAVVDAGALGAPCVQVVLAWLDDPTTPTPVHRVSVPDAAVEDVLSTDPAIVIDRICPATGLFAYTIDAAEGAPVLVIVAQVDADAPPPTPSRFGDEVAGRHPSSGLTILPVALVASSRAECAAGDAAACLALAALARDGIEGAGTVREALEPRCRDTGGLPCDVLAGAIEAGGGEADALERRACSTGAPDACMRRGARFLAGASDLAAAYQTFGYGCTHACVDCCAAAETMREWELAPPGAPEDPAEPR